MSSVKDLSDAELRSELIGLGFAAGPVTGSTRKIYEKKLETLRNAAPAANGKSTSAVVAKPTPAKTITYQPPSPAAVASVSKKKAQVFDSSDEELDLTVSSFVESPRSPACQTVKRTAVLPPPQSVDRSSLSQPRPTTGHSNSGNVTSKRPPTPPRAIRTATRTPQLPKEPIVPASERGRNDVSSSILGSAVFTSSNSFMESFDHSSVIGGGGGAKTLPIFQQPPPQAADDENDDHMETSRIVPRFRPSGNFSTSGTGLGGGRHSSGFGTGFSSYRVSPADMYSAKYRAPTAVGGSSMDRLRRISKGAWEFFSPPPVDDFQNSPSLLRGSHDNKYFSKYSPNTSRLSVGKSVKIRQSTAAGNSSSSSAVAYCLVGLAAVGSVIVVGYTWKTHPEAVHHGVDVTVGFATTAVNYFFAYLIVPLVIFLGVGLLVGAAYKFNQFCETRNKERQERLLALVDRITDIIRDNESEGIAELHVRDILLPPTKRTNDDWALWKDAAKFINMEDSRVRTELRLVNGDECNVWVWVPITKQK